MGNVIEKEKGTNKANLEVFSDTLISLAENDRDIIVVTSDSRGSGKLTPFGKKFPKQIVEVGIAEQNLVGVAAGLASAGKKVFAVSPACFLTARALEQIKNDVAYSDNPVKVIGISAGVSYGALGSTHHSLHDYAVLRAINNITVVAPADNFETEQAAIKLEKENGINATVVSMHTIKPLDHDLINTLALKCNAIITIEEHSVYGGLGEACASFLLQNGLDVRFKIIGIPDEYTVTGSQIEILNHYGISENGIAETALKLLEA